MMTTSSENSVEVMPTYTTATMTGLKPPDRLTNLSSEGFTKWKQRFEIYRIASGAGVMSEEVQIAILLHCIGESCIDVYNTFSFDNEEDKKKYDVVLKKFEDYFVPVKNESVNSHVFFTRNQHQNETFDVYLTELRRLSADCNFGELKDRLIRDRIVAGIIDKRLRDRLLRESDLDLNKTIKICKAMELAEQQIKQFEPQAVELSAISKKTSKNVSSMKKQAGYNQQRAANTNEKGDADKQQSSEKRQCQRCGYTHRYKNCPAYNKECKKCGKKGHFIKMCKLVCYVRDKNVKMVQCENDDSFIDGVNELMFDMIQVNSINVKKSWVKHLNFVDYKNKKIAFKIDTGAECNVLPIDYCKKLGIKEIKSSNIILKTYRGEKIKTLGKVNLNCGLDKKCKNIEFQIYDGKGVPILGLPTLEELHIVKRDDVEIDELIENELNSIEKNKSQMIFEKFKENFTGIGKIKDYEYKIELKEGSSGKIEPSRHVPFKLINKLKIELKQMESSGIISKVDKPTDFVNSMVIVAKPDKSIRICLDPQYLNRCIKREHIQLPTVDEIAARIKGAKVFAVLDAHKGFWQIELSEESQDLTTFNTPFGRYKFKRMPYGLSSCPEVFHKTFKKIFNGIKNLEVYIDDILIWAESDDELMKILEKVFERAKQYNVKFNVNKCKFLVKRVKYLGHILTENGIEVDEEKVESIKRMKTPENKKELLTFLGMVNYVQKFIPNCAQLTGSLRQLIKNGVPYVWGNTQKESFLKLKEILCTPPVLVYFNVNEQITLSVDASSEGMGCVIIQNGRPVAYGSRALTTTEKSYSQIEKECLAIVHGCTKFNQYLFGQRFIVETDHKPLVSIFKKPMNKCPPRLQRMMISLNNYDFELRYVPGKKLVVADHLSRTYLKNFDQTNEEKIEAFVACIESSYNITDERLLEIKDKTKNDQQLQEVLKYIKNGWPENKYDVTELAKPFFNFKEEMSEYNGLIVKNTCIVVPKEMRSYMLKKIHYAHFGKEKCKALARKSIFWIGMSKQIDDLVNNCDVCKSYQRENTKEPMLKKEIPNEAWEILSSDIFFLLGEQYLIIVDAYSKYIEISRLPDQTTESVIKILKENFARYGIPKILYTDSGPQYTSKAFWDFKKEWSFEHKITTPKHHQSNGLAERHIQTIKRVLKKIIQERKDIDLALLQCRNTPFNDSNLTPAEIMYRRKVKNIIPDFHKRVINTDHFKELLRERQNKQKRYYDKNAKDLKDFQKGDKVMIHAEGKQKPHEKGLIIEKDTNPRSYKVKTEQGQIIKRNRKHLSKGVEFNERNDIIDDTLVEKEQMIPESQPQIRLNSPVTPIVTTRSGRVVNKPSYLKDYVCVIKID